MSQHRFRSVIVYCANSARGSDVLAVESTEAITGKQVHATSAQLPMRNWIIELLVSVERSVRTCSKLLNGDYNRVHSAKYPTNMTKITAEVSCKNPEFKR